MKVAEMVSRQHNSIIGRLSVKPHWVLKTKETDSLREMNPVFGKKIVSNSSVKKYL